MQRRSGSVLPPPLDDYCNSSSASAGGTVIKNGSNVSINCHLERNKLDE